MATADLNPETDQPEPSSADLEPGTSVTAPLMPIPSGVVFPEMVVTVALETDESQAAASAAVDDTVVLVPRIDGTFSNVGVVARIENRGTLRNGLPALTIRATHRAQLGLGVIGTGDSLWVEAEVLSPPTSDKTKGLAAAYRGVATELLERLGGRRLGVSLPEVDDPSALADTIAYWPEVSLAQRVELLETIAVDPRLELATDWANKALEELEVAQRVNEDVTESLESDQREMLLRRQLAAIQKELGEGETNVIADFRDRLERSVTVSRRRHRKPSRPRSTASNASANRAKKGPGSGPGSTRSSSCRGISERSTTSTWTRPCRPRRRSHRARRREGPRRRALWPCASSAPSAASTTPRSRQAAILTLVGPPGVGKTSLGESIAARWAAVRPHGARWHPRRSRDPRPPRTYVGRRPGRLVRALAEAGTMNPVILLDEIDKLGATGAATRRRPCSRCSTPPRTTASATTTSSSSSTSPTSCSSRRPTDSTPSRAPARSGRDHRARRLHRRREDDHRCRHLLPRLRRRWARRRTT